jgi:hypothetical protein
MANHSCRDVDCMSDSDHECCGGPGCHDCHPPRVRAIVRDEPPPVKNDLPCIQDLVIADIEARKAVGLERYGTLLQPFNGRDALMDAYAEALDLCQYLRQAIEERDAKKTTAVFRVGDVGPDGA